ncbi:MAG: BatA and WFA domain-containing protein [Armatimonadota bacterium]|nr:BatA and WFA domain-containing protein [Armatimonadota bacterium]
MVLGSPAALWALLLVPLVILLYMLRARRQVLVVPSTLLWERAARDLVARMPVRKLERSVLLLLQVLTIAAVVLALSRPSVTLPGLAGDAVVLVIRTGASMQATDEAPSRLAVAQRDALALVERLGPQQVVALVAAGRGPQLAVDFTGDRAALAAAIGGLRASDAHAPIDEAVALAASLRAGGRPAQVHVFSDRPPSDARARWHRVGRGAANAAITAAAVRQDAGGRARLLVRLEVFGGSLPPRVLTVSLDGRPMVQRPVSLTPQAPQTIIVDLGAASGAATVRLQGGDALAADDRAVVAVGAAALPRLLVVGGPNPVLDAVLAAVPTAGVARAERVAPEEWGRADLVVLDGIDPIPLPPGAYLAIGTIGTNLPLQIEGTARHQTVRAVTATHPVARLADLRGVRVASALALRPQAGSVIAEGDVPLVWAYDGRGVRIVLLPFVLNQTDLPLHPGFPVLIANAIAWLVESPQVAPGDAPLVPAGRMARGTLVDPVGGTRPVEANGGLFALPPLERVGVWRLRTETWERRWIVSTADPRESDLQVDGPQRPQTAGGLPQPAALSLAPWLLGLASVVLFGEWLLWARTVPRGPVRRPPS